MTQTQVVINVCPYSHNTCLDSFLELIKVVSLNICRFISLSSSKIVFVVYRNLALGIGIQNFPEGLAVSLPLKASGMNIWKSFW